MSIFIESLKHTQNRTDNFDMQFGPKPPHNIASDPALFKHDLFAEAHAVAKVVKSPLAVAQIF